MADTASTLNVLQNGKRPSARWLIYAPLAVFSASDPEPPARCGFEGGKAVLRRGAPLFCLATKYRRR